MTAFRRLIPMSGPGQCRSYSAVDSHQSLPRTKPTRQRAPAVSDCELGPARPKAAASGRDEASSAAPIHGMYRARSSAHSASSDRLVSLPPSCRPSSPSDCSPPSPACSSATALRSSKWSSPSTPAPTTRSYLSVRLACVYTLPHHASRTSRVAEALPSDPSTPGRRRTN